MDTMYARVILEDAWVGWVFATCLYLRSYPHVASSRKKKETTTTTDDWSD